MAIMQMQRIQICALKKDRKKILELLQRRGIVEIDERIEPDALVTKTDTSQTRAVFACFRNMRLKRIPCSLPWRASRWKR